MGTRPNCKLYGDSVITVLKFNLDHCYAVHTQQKSQSRQRATEEPIAANLEVDSCLRIDWVLHQTTDSLLKEMDTDVNISLPGYILIVL